MDYNKRESKFQALIKRESKPKSNFEVLIHHCLKDILPYTKLHRSEVIKILNQLKGDK